MGNCQVTFQPTQDQVDKMIKQNIAQQCFACITEL